MTRYRAGKPDDNQAAIVAALRDVGASVLILSGVGKGCPDLLVGYRGVNILIEIKDGAKPPSKRRLTKDEADFMADWRGQWALAKEIDEALRLIGAIPE